MCPPPPLVFGAPKKPGLDRVKTVVFSLTNALRDKHVQICRSSLSAAMQTVQMSVEARLSTAVKSSSVVP